MRNYASWGLAAAMICLPVGNTIPSFWLAVATSVCGSVILVRSYRSPGRCNRLPLILATVSAAILATVLAMLYALSWSAASGMPL